MKVRGIFQYRVISYCTSQIKLYTVMLYHALLYCQTLPLPFLSSQQVTTKKLSTSSSSLKSLGLDLGLQPRRYEIIPTSLDVLTWLGLVSAYCAAFAVPQRHISQLRRRLLLQLPLPMILITARTANRSEHTHHPESYRHHSVAVIVIIVESSSSKSSSSSSSRSSSLS